MKVLLKSVMPFLVYVLVIALAVFIVHWNRQDGYDEGFKVAKAEGDAALSDLRGEIATGKQQAAEQARVAAETATQALAVEIKRGDVLASQLATAKDELRKNTDRLTGEIQRVTTRYRRALDAPPEPLPAAVFTTGFVRVWNKALNPVAMYASQPTSGTAAPAGSPGAADDLDSGITPAALLTNQVRNSEKHAVCRAQLTSLIEYYTHGR